MIASGVPLGAVWWAWAPGGREVLPDPQLRDVIAQDGTLAVLLLGFGATLGLLICGRRDRAAARSFGVFIAAATVAAVVTVVTGLVLDGPSAGTAAAGSDLAARLAASGLPSTVSLQVHAYGVLLLAPIAAAAVVFAGQLWSFTTRSTRP